jgi:hypothetical protein
MKYLGIILFVVYSSSCAVQVHTLQDNTVDYSKYKTFCWLEGCEFTYTGPSYLNDSLWREVIKESVVDELVSKGFTKDDNNPDILVSFYISVENQTSVSYKHVDELYGYQDFPEAEVIDYLKGTIIIDIVDKDLGKMVWRSESIGYMEIHPDLTEKNIRKGIALTLKKFPPKK